MPPNAVSEGYKAARSLRREQYYTKDQPIDPWLLAEKLGITVFVRRMRERSVSGAYLYRPIERRSFVMINASDILSRQRFTLAHEIGHFVFDRESTVIDDDIFGTKTHPEKRANAFAAELLLPEAALRRWNPRSVWGTSADDIAHLATTYGLSFEATIWRLKSMAMLEDVDAAKHLVGHVSPASRFALSARDDEIVRLPTEFVKLTEDALEAALISEKRYRELRPDLDESFPF